MKIPVSNHIVKKHVYFQMIQLSSSLSSLIMMIIDNDNDIAVSLYNYPFKTQNNWMVPCISFLLIIIWILAFSLTSYGSSHDLDLNNISEIGLIYLYDYIGISTYLLPKTCNRSSEHFQPARKGWKIGTYCNLLQSWSYKLGCPSDCTVMGQKCKDFLNWLVLPYTLHNCCQNTQSN